MGSVTTDVTGYAALYMRDGSANSEVSVNGSELIGKNNNPYHESNAFATIILEDDNIELSAWNGTADTSDDKTATCAVTVSPAGYSVSLKSGTEDATSWQGKAGTDDYQELPLTGLEAGTAVSVKYNGTKKVKSVKAKKKQ